MEQAEPGLTLASGEVLDDLAARVVERLLTRDSLDGVAAVDANGAAAVGDRSAGATAASPTASTPIPPILMVVGVESTQATQFFDFNGQGSGAAADNSVPLVAHKALVLRVYINYLNVQNPTATLQVTGSVTCNRISPLPTGVTPLPAATAINSPMSAMSAGAIQRGRANATLNFLVPASSCQGQVQFQIKVWGAANAALNSPVVVQYASFGSVPPPPVHGVLIHYTGPNDSRTGNLNIPAPTRVDLLNTLAPVIGVYPIDWFYYTGWTVITFNGDLTTQDGWNLLFNTLLNMRSSSGTNDVYVGLLPSSVPTGGIFGYGGAGVAVSYVDAGMVFAQEIGHSFNRAHAPCGNPGNPDPNYPTYNSYPSGSIGEFGYNVGTNSVFDPSSTYDFMSYCSPVWTSPYTYIGLKNAISSSNAASSAERPHTRNHVIDRLHINVRVHRGGRIELLPSFHLFGHVPDAGIERGPASDVRCDLMSAEGKVLFSQRCHLANLHHSLDDLSYDLHEVLPWFDDVETIVFRRGSEVVGDISIGEAPKLTLCKPKLERRVLTVEWTAQATSTAPEPTCLVRYSNDDGATWRTIAADLTSGRHQVSLDTLPGGPRCRVQVVAAAAIRTATAESEPFEVETQARKAYLVNPREPVTVTLGEMVTLQGDGFSPDQGMAPFTDVRWSSSQDGNLGIGYELATSNLSVGFHIITLSVPDGAGGLATATAQVTIEEPSYA